MLKILFLLSYAIMCLNLLFSEVVSNDNDEDKPLIMAIGASFVEPKIPFNVGMTTPFFGGCINSCDMLGLADALKWQQYLVVSEAQGGATTFERNGCNPECIEGHWDSYETQLFRALARVYDQSSDTLQSKYLIVGIPNDCIHPDAFGVPINKARKCTTEDLDAVISRLISIGQIALDVGVVPLFSNYPDYASWDMDLLTEVYNLPWGIPENDFNYLKGQLKSRLISELPGAVLVDTWGEGFERIPGDPLHPNKETSLRAVDKILNAINILESGRQLTKFNFENLTG